MFKLYTVKAKLKNTYFSIKIEIFDVLLCSRKSPTKYASTTINESQADRYTAIKVIKRAMNTIPSRTYAIIILV